MRLILRAGWLLAAALSGCGEPAPPASRVELEREDGALVKAFTVVARADDPASRERGLASRAPLAAEEAMVLAFPVVDAACITNANVTFPIVAVYAGPDGAVVGIDALAAHDERVRCHDGVLTVIELAGTALADTREAARALVR